jgi:hypothetical protein
MSNLPDLEATIRAAHSAAITADNIATVAIRVSLKKRILAGEALAAARELVPPDEREAWQAGLGLTPRDAHRLHTFHDQRKYARFDTTSQGDLPERADLPLTLAGARQQLRQLRASLDGPVERLEAIARRAGLLKTLFWDSPWIRETAFALQLDAQAPQGRVAA